MTTSSRYSTPTAWSLIVQQTALTGKPFSPTENTTLNEKFNISVPTPQLGTRPKLAYIALGKGAHANGSTSDGLPIPIIHKHEPTDAAAYMSQPWVLRLQTNDLSPVLQANYALRRAEIHDGLNYWAYYLKRYDFAAAPVTLNRITNVGGNEQSVPYTPNSSNLNPTPPVIPSDQSIPSLASGDAIDVGSITTVRISQFDIDELIEVARIVHNDERAAIISEVLFCTGVDMATTVPNAGGTPMSFTECAWCQVAQFLTLFEPLEVGKEHLDINVDLGSGEALSTSI